MKTTPPGVTEYAALERKTYEFKGPRSFCKCGHTGDGRSLSEHAGMFGHGPCSRCPCKKFTWFKWTSAFMALVEKVRK